MSATNRGSVRRRDDFYATPLDSVQSFLDNFPYIHPDDTILEPSAGNGNIIRALRNYGVHNHITAIELRQEERCNLQKISDKVLICNFLLEDITEKYDIIIGNPPYNLAQEFIDKSLSLLNPGGKLIFLLRTNFLESKKRFEWWQDKIPDLLFVLHKRPSFIGGGLMLRPIAGLSGRIHLK